jgi:hypothetical protein
MRLRYRIMRYRTMRESDLSHTKKAAPNHQEPLVTNHSSRTTRRTQSSRTTRQVVSCNLSHDNKSTPNHHSPSSRVIHPFLNNMLIQEAVDCVIHPFLHNIPKDPRRSPQIPSSDPCQLFRRQLFRRQLFRRPPAHLTPKPSRPTPTPSRRESIASQHQSCKPAPEPPPNKTSEPD